MEENEKTEKEAAVAETTGITEVAKMPETVEITEVTEETEKAEKKKKKRESVAYNIAIIAMFVAVIAVCAWASIPISAIAITLQTFAVCMAAALLGWKRGLATVVAYILLGLVGVPVFSKFQAGASVLAGVTGGYIIGFLFTAVIVGVVSDILKRVKPKKIFEIIFLAAAMVVGIAVCYAFGTAWYVAVCNAKGNSVTVYAALSMCVFPYIVPDLVKVVVAVAIYLSVKKYVK